MDTNKYRSIQEHMDEITKRDLQNKMLDKANLAASRGMEMPTSAPKQMPKADLSEKASLARKNQRKRT